ncbi:MAG: exodeoxyribonuclease VII large subunit, partial [Deltaproteobacteria bacterium]|nr:exodeoxyribonuclease VII large subunit [Deltaproteobacteria bacterium]
RLVYTLTVSIDRQRQQLAKLLSNLDHLSPLAVLAKGYAVVQRPGDAHSIRSARELKLGEELKLLFHEGTAQANVSKVNVR